MFYLNSSKSNFDGLTCLTSIRNLQRRLLTIKLEDLRLFRKLFGPNVHWMVKFDGQIDDNFVRKSLHVSSYCEVKFVRTLTRNIRTQILASRHCFPGYHVIHIALCTLLVSLYFVSGETCLILFTRFVWHKSFFPDLRSKRLIRTAMLENLDLKWILSLYSVARLHFSVNRFIVFSIANILVWSVVKLSLAFSAFTARTTRKLLIFTLHTAGGKSNSPLTIFLWEDGETVMWKSFSENENEQKT